MSKWWDKSITLVEGCSPVSEGCKKCWSAVVTHRFHHSKGLTANNRFNGKIICRGDRLDEILKRKKPTRWTIWNDLFHPSVEIGFLTHVFDTIEQCPQHIFQILTKRPENIKTLWANKSERGDNWQYMREGTILPNVWWGTSCENQKWLDIRAPLILQIPAAVIFLSLEPMLGSMDIKKYIWLRQKCVDKNGCGFTGASYEFDNPKKKEAYRCPQCGKNHNYLCTNSVDWVIIGVESNGAHLNRMGEFESWYKWLEAAFRIVHQCKTTSVPVFVKQIPRYENGKWRLEKDITKFPKSLQYQDFPEKWFSQEYSK